MQSTINMETYRVSDESVQHFTTVFSQNGKGLDIDRYIYNQQGAGIGSFFAKLFRSVLPVAKTAINTAARIAKPHVQKIASEVIQETQRGLINQIGNIGNKTIKRINKRKVDELDDE